nr:immunoglobulin light chain junction region [Macaca mulatta]MOV35358.1 immunoglobulin light chain junction region [Macaca mulatta]
CMQGIEYPRTF